MDSKDHDHLIKDFTKTSIEVNEGVLDNIFQNNNLSSSKEYRELLFNNLDTANEGDFKNNYTVIKSEKGNREKFILESIQPLEKIIM